MTTPRQARLDEIAAALNIPKATQDILDEGSSHPGTCRCETCWRWWKLMGPDEVGDFGPFTEEEIRASTHAGTTLHGQDDKG
jgi:hypothetical protein